MVEEMGILLFYFILIVPIRSTKCIWLNVEVLRVG